MFLYFVPTDDITIATHGIPPALRYAFEGKPLEAGVISGPDGSAGLILANRPHAGRLGYFPTEQTWGPIPGSDCYVGFAAASLPLHPAAPLPVPSPFARANELAGKNVADSLGNLWHIPFAMNYLELGEGLWPVPQLPQRLTLGEGGQWVRGQVMPAYAQLWQLVSDYGQALAEAVIAVQAEDEQRESFVFSFDRLDDLAIAALQVNYRLGPVELDLLGIYDETFRQEVIDTVRGMPLLAALKKKQAPAGGSSSPPAAASTPANLPE